MAKRTNKLPASHRTAGAVAGDDGNTPASVTVRELSQLIRADRLERGRSGQRMTWPAYALFLGVPQSTVYKIAQGRTGRPHETTIDRILAVIRDNPIAASPPRPRPTKAVRTRGEGDSSERRPE